jgi:hypothetical protein
MKNHKRKNGKNKWTSVAIAGAAIVAAGACGGCLSTIVPAMAGPSTTYPQSADNQPAPQPSSASQPASQPANDQTNQSNQNKQQNGMPPNGAQPQGQGGTL